MASIALFDVRLGGNGMCALKKYTTVSVNDIALLMWLEID
jgi:hypothetical protein